MQRGSPVKQIPAQTVSDKKNSCKLKTVGLRCAHKKKPCFVTLKLFSGRLPVKIVKTVNDRHCTLLAESLRSFLDESGKGKEERGS